MAARLTVNKRDDFTSRFIEQGTSAGPPMAAIDWDAAITALSNGELPRSAGERLNLAAAASIAAGIPVDLRDTATGLDTRNIQRLISATTASTATSGKRCSPAWDWSGRERLLKVMADVGVLWLQLTGRGITAGTSPISGGSGSYPGRSEPR